MEKANPNPKSAKRKISHVIYKKCGYSDIGNSEGVGGMKFVYNDFDLTILILSMTIYA